MEDGVSTFETVPNLVENAEISVVVSVQEFKIESDGLAAIKNLSYRIVNLDVLI